jgi:hypothetical protein
MKQPPEHKTGPHSATPAEQLNALLKTKDYVPFEVNIPDKEYPYITLSIYGATKTNEIFVQLTNGKANFVEVIRSPLLYPSMGDRIFGMDVTDADVSFKKAESMWQKHREELVRK